MTYQPQNQNLTTGVLSMPLVTVNTDTTKFDISSGTIVIEDWSNPDQMRLKFLSYSGVTAQAPPDGVNDTFTKLTLVESTTDGEAELLMEGNGIFTSQTRREEVALPSVIHAAVDAVIATVTTDIQIAYGWAQSTTDMNHCRGACNDGNIITANGANLNIDKASGSTGQEFLNASTSSWLSPAVRTNSQVSSHSFLYQAQDPAGPFVTGFVTDIDPDNYDNAGTLTSMPNNRWQIQRVYYFGQSNTMTISYGQVVYNTRLGAEQGIAIDSVITPENTAEGVWICSLVLKSGTTDLSDTAANSIVNR